LLYATELMGASAYDDQSNYVGRVREFFIEPAEQPNRVSHFLISRGRFQPLVARYDQIAKVAPGRIDLSVSERALNAYQPNEAWLAVQKDLLDQQIIDVFGRKVVRVNDVDIHEELGHDHIVLKLSAVDVGARGAMRRLLKGVVPAAALRPMVEKIPPRMIPWEFVDLIETDPARRVKLKISLDRLAKLHPADIADIVEELAPAEREAVFETLDEEVAAETLEELDPKMQVSVLSALDSERAADIVEEMDPDAAADVLGDMPPETTEEILTEMEPEERAEVAELMSFEEDTAAGRMTTDYMALKAGAKVADAIEMLRNFEGGIESVSTIYIIGEREKLLGQVPLAKIVLATPETPLMLLSTGHMSTIHPGADEKEVAELFDKYNLLTLPVIDDEGVLTGVITADDVINMLRKKM